MSEQIKKTESDIDFKKKILIYRKMELIGLDCINGLICSEGRHFNPTFWEDAGLYNIEIPDRKLKGKIVCVSWKDCLKLEILELTSERWNRPKQ